MLYFIETRVTRKRENISSPSQEIVSHIVHASNAKEAEEKYKAAVRQRYANEPVVKIDYEPLRFATEIL